MITDVPSKIEASDDTGDQEYRTRTTTGRLSKNKGRHLLAIVVKLGDVGQEPQNVQVNITEYDRMTIAVLCDEHRRVVECTLEEETALSGQDRELDEEPSGDVGCKSEGIMIAERLVNETAALEDEISLLASNNAELRERTSHLAEDITFQRGGE